MSSETEYTYLVKQRGGRVGIEQISLLLTWTEVTSFIHT